MITLSRSLPVNPAGTTSLVTAAEVWKGLELKADNALPFVPQMTYCQVLEREKPNQFVREIEFRGDRMKERVTLEHGKSVTFVRLSGPVLGTIHNYIDEKPTGLELRFDFALELTGAAAGSQAEKDYAAKMEQAYLGAVDATLAAIRKLHDQGGAMSQASAVNSPAWLTQFYSDVDNQRMEAFLAHFTDGGKVYFGNNPPAVGKDQIKGAIGGLWSSIKGLKHTFVHVWEAPNTALLEAKIDYHRMDGKTVTVPCVSVLDRQGDKVSELRIHIDLAPVFAP